MLKRVMTHFFVEFFLSQCQKILQEKPSVLCFGKFPVANKFMDNKGGFWSHSAETIRRGTLLCTF